MDEPAGVPPGVQVMALVVTADAVATPPPEAGEVDGDG